MSTTSQQPGAETRSTPSAEARVTDPYGHLEWCIGNGDDFWCFDFHVHDDDTVTLHAVVNSETGAFIQDVEPPMRVPKSQAVTIAQRLTEAAIDWCHDNEMKHDQLGWNQSSCYFWRSVHCAITGGDFAIRIPVKMKQRPQITRNYL